MNLKDFIKLFADQFDDTDISEFKADSNFRDFDEWSSLTGMAVMNMIDKKMGKRISVAEFQSVDTIEQLFNLIQAK